MADVRANIDAEDVRATVRVMNYEQRPVAVRFRQPLPGAVEPAQVSVPEDEDWSVDPDRLQFVAKLPWATDLTRRYSIADLGDRDLGELVRTATLDVVDMDGDPVAAELSIRADGEELVALPAEAKREEGRSGVTTDSSADPSPAESTGGPDAGVEQAAVATPADARSESPHEHALDDAPDTLAAADLRWRDR